PGLNPAALTLTFLLLPGRVAVMRVLGAATIVLLLPWLIERFVPVTAAPSTSGRKVEEPPTTFAELGARFVKALVRLALITVPLIAVGVFLSSLLLPLVPTLSGRAGLMVIGVVAVCGTLIALPTFFELPLAAILLQLGAPVGAATALLIA